MMRVRLVGTAVGTVPACTFVGRHGVFDLGLVGILLIVWIIQFRAALARHGGRAHSALATAAGIASAGATVEVVHGTE